MAPKANALPLNPSLGIVVFVNELGDGIPDSRIAAPASPDRQDSRIFHCQARNEWDFAGLGIRVLNPFQYPVGCLIRPKITPGKEAG